MKKGEITVFLSLTVVLLVSFILGMMNAANIQLMKNQARIDVDSALYSLFGEYQTDLLEEYHIFGIEETYGTGNLQEENLLRRMHYFGTEGIVHEIKGIQYLTDLDGMGLREQIITEVVFDRGGFIYQGKIKALADAAREAGLNF